MLPAATRMTWTSCAVLVLLSCGLCEGKTMVFGGGKLDQTNADIWNKIVDLAGGRGVARIGIISAGHRAPVTVGEKYTALFAGVYGAAEAYWIPVRETDPGQAYDELVVANVLRMTGFYYSGGNQPRVIGTLLTSTRGDTPVMAAIRRRYEEGAVVSGSSGGALVQPGCLTVVAGWSYQACKYGSMKVGDNGGTRDLVFDEQGGLGFIKSHVVDAHFSERGREGRLVRLLSDTQKRSLGTSRGFGVDENTILVVEDVDGLNPTGEVVGYHGVVFVDVADSVADNIGTFWQVRGVTMDYLTAGDRINMSDHRVRFAADKVSVIGSETRDNASPSIDVFLGAEKGMRSEFRRAAETLFDSRLDTTNYGRSAQSTPAYFVIMTQQVTSRAVRMLDDRISYSNMKVDIRPLET